MKNYAGVEDIDEELAAELEGAGIKAKRMEVFKNRGREVNTSVIGTLHGWSFERAWYYWVAKGPGIPPADAEELHERHGKEIRVNGHCGCPSPKEQFGGFAVGHYHIDSQEGLNALAATIRKIVARV